MSCPETIQQNDLTATLELSVYDNGKLANISWATQSVQIKFRSAAGRTTVDAALKTDGTDSLVVYDIPGSMSAVVGSHSGQLLLTGAQGEFFQSHPKVLFNVAQNL